MLIMIVLVLLHKDSDNAHISPGLKVKKKRQGHIAFLPLAEGSIVSRHKGQAEKKPSPNVGLHGDTIKRRASRLSWPLVF